jgi:hypothetical protein
MNRTFDICADLHPSLIVRRSDNGGAVFDRAQKYRYLLWRNMPKGKGSILLVMLNPNRADEMRNDPTIRRCISFADSWGYKHIEVVNLFAYKAEKPDMLKTAKRPVGTHNNSIIQKRAVSASLRIVAWGNHGRLFERDEEVLAMLNEHGPVFCLGTTKSGAPRHPLYLRSDVRPLAFGAGVRSLR